MRIEQITAKALENVGHDKYLLAKAVGKRAEAIARGAMPWIKLDPKKFKSSDIALREIAEGKILVHFEE